MSKHRLDSAMQRLQPAQSSGIRSPLTADVYNRKEADLVALVATARSHSISARRELNNLLSPHASVSSLQSSYCTVSGNVKALSFFLGHLRTEISSLEQKAKESTMVNPELEKRLPSQTKLNAQLE